MTDTETKKTTFQPVTSKVDFPALEREIMEFWNETNVVEDYLHRNDDAPETWSFIDGPITANNPMGVHHAWGRTYQDLFQRYHNLLGKEQRFQNGFDAQGLWVEVEVEKEIGLKNKREIEEFGIAEFVERCKAACSSMPIASASRASASAISWTGIIVITPCPMKTITAFGTT